MFSRIAAAYALLDGVRRLLVNLLFLLTLVTLAVVFWVASEAPNLPKGTLLRIELVGEVQESGPAEPSFMLSMFGQDSFEENTRLADVVDALDRAAHDDRIAGVVLRVDDLAGAGMASIREIGAAIDRYRQTSGRQVWTWSTSYTQPQYLVAAHADHVGIHPMGDAIVKGLSATTFYWGPLLNAAGLEVEVHKAGAFKSAPEIFTSGRPSAESLAAQKSYMDDAWAGLVTRLEARRGLVNGTVEKLIAGIAKDGTADKSLSVLFREAGLIDELETRDAYLQKLADKYAGGQVKDLKAIDATAYLAATETVPAGDTVAVLIAEGEITGMPELGGMTPDGINGVIDEIQEDPKDKALVVRVNSPGGDAVAAELIRARLVEYKKKTGNPVIISMGDTAASGGYWIATAGDRIVADPLSITGSIGVFAMSVHAEGLREELKVGRGGYRTTPLADFGNPAAAPGDVERRLIEGGVSRTYADFKKLVAESRNMSVEEVERVAQGRVWTGAQAVKFGLADAQGGLDEALKLACREAKLPAETASVLWEPVDTSWRGALRALLQSRAGAAVGKVLEVRQTLDALAAQSNRPLAWAPFEPTL